MGIMNKYMGGNDWSKMIPEMVNRYADLNDWVNLGNSSEEYLKHYASLETYIKDYASSERTFVETLKKEIKKTKREWHGIIKMDQKEGIYNKTYEKYYNDTDRALERLTEYEKRGCPGNMITEEFKKKIYKAMHCEIIEIPLIGDTALWRKVNDEELDASEIGFIEAGYIIYTGLRYEKQIREIIKKIAGKHEYKEIKERIDEVSELNAEVKEDYDKITKLLGTGRKKIEGLYEEMDVFHRNMKGNFKKLFSLNEYLEFLNKKVII